jgi:hypothetical protein
MQTWEGRRKPGVEQQQAQQLLIATPKIRQVGYFLRWSVMIVVDNPVLVIGEICFLAYC